MIQFPKGYFDGETRNDFYIEPMMKCAWAAQQEIVLVIDRICKKYGIKYFADYGTLLGAVRHEGFIPWDDDIDIGFLRSDYDRFLEVAESELPEEYEIFSPRKTPGYAAPFARVLNAHSVSYSMDRLTKFHGFPFTAGVDVFPIDTVPKNNAEREILFSMFDIVHACYKRMKKEPEEVLESLSDVEEFSGFKFDREGDIQLQFGNLVDDIEKKYESCGNNEITHMMFHREDDIMKKEWFEEVIYVPFEQIEIPIPAAYDNILTALYGSDYMTPKIIYDSHEYPFYKKQYNEVVDILVERKMKGERLWQ